MIPKEIVIHHSASGSNTPISEIDRWHKQREFPKSTLGFYVGYHYVILSSGQVIQTRRDIEIGAHSPPNDGAIGVCVVGNFELSEPTKDQITSLVKVVDELKKVYNITEVWGHKDRNSTACPGRNLYKYVEKLSTINRLQRLIKKLKSLLLHA
jgi:hypothetical protein